MFSVSTRAVWVVVLLFGMNTIAEIAVADDGENDPQAKATAKQFFKVFTGADVEKMKEYFADQILFDGERRFIGRDKLDNPAALTKRQLADAYSKLFERVPVEKWKQLLDKSKPSLLEAPADGEPVKFAKKGDYVYDLHFREAIKGQRAGLDEAVIFVFRKVDGKYRIVAHFADY